MTSEMQRLRAEVPLSLVICFGAISSSASSSRAGGGRVHLRLIPPACLVQSLAQKPPLVAIKTTVEQAFTAQL